MEALTVRLGTQLLEKIDEAADQRDVSRSEKIRSDLNQKYFED